MLTQEAELCRYIDNQLQRESGDPDLLDSGAFPVEVRRGDKTEYLTRERSCRVFTPSTFVLDRVMKHLTTPARQKPGMRGIFPDALGYIKLGHNYLN